MTTPASVAFTPLFSTQTQMKTPTKMYAAGRILPHLALDRGLAIFSAPTCSTPGSVTAGLTPRGSSAAL